MGEPLPKPLGFDKINPDEGRVAWHDVRPPGDGCLLAFCRYFRYSVAKSDKTKEHYKYQWPF
jgi:hypothetical protein